MDFIKSVYEKRKKLADVLEDEEYSGIREIVEELYPDYAHFIYELLQNAEDAKATIGKFYLYEDHLVFEHNGRPFNKDDVLSITNIGKGTKKDKVEEIGKFGIGFKAVFAHCETPFIYSPTFSFKITSLVLPHELKYPEELKGWTRFVFPFNNKKRDKSDSYNEIKTGLESLNEHTLLFLTNINKIMWVIDENKAGEIERVEYSNHYIELIIRMDGEEEIRKHFLKFTTPVKKVPEQKIAIAYELKQKSNVKKINSKKPKLQQMEIVPADLGIVSIYFPAKKETSNLKFHLHAPFVPELSRASVKETPVNHPLFYELADLVVHSLYRIKEMGLLNRNFLAVLPNPNDQIPERYIPIHEAILNNMKSKALTPTYNKSYAPASRLIQGKAVLKDLLDIEDLKFLFNEADEKPVDWAISATQKNSRIDHFLESLEIKVWDIEEFGDLVLSKTKSDWYYTADKDFLSWLSSKSIEWHQNFYIILNDYLKVSHYHRMNELQKAKIIKTTKNRYCKPKNCYFVTKDIEFNESLNFVDPSLYRSGDNQEKLEKVKQFFEDLGIREVEENDQIKLILDHRYSSNNVSVNSKVYVRDLKRFIDFINRNPEDSSIFEDYCILKSEDGEWRRSGDLFIDVPLKNTGLKLYYELFEENERYKRFPVSKEYKNMNIPLDTLIRFMKKIGVIDFLEVKETNCYNNPKWDYLSQVSGRRWTYTGIDRDYFIPKFEEFVEQMTIEKAKLIWNTLDYLRGYFDLFCATFQYNQSSGSRTADSQFLYQIKDNEWVPQKGGKFVKPCFASSDLLPEGFPFDSGKYWIVKVRFGESYSKSYPPESASLGIYRDDAEEDDDKIIAQKLGLEDEEDLEFIKKVIELEPDKRKQIWKMVQKFESDLPHREPKNVERRIQGVSVEINDAIDKRSAIRIRSVSLGLSQIKEEAETYLRHQYTNEDEEMICQICKAELPFKLRNGEYYFEKVELLPNLSKRLYQNYIALCPNHAAMFLYANDSDENLKNSLLELALEMEDLEPEECQLRVKLAGNDETIYFTKTHLLDLKTIIDEELEIDEDTEIED